MALYAREREREAESESLVFERQFVKELSDTAGDVIKQLHTPADRQPARLTVRQITVNRPLTQYTHAQTHTHTRTHTHNKIYKTRILLLLLLLLFFYPR